MSGRHRLLERVRAPRWSEAAGSLLVVLAVLVLAGVGLAVLVFAVPMGAPR